MNYKYCPNCGAKVKSSAKFCISCGYKFKSNDISVDHKSNLDNNITSRHKIRESYKNNNLSYDHVLLAITIFICFIIWVFLMDSKPFLTVSPSVLAAVVAFIGTCVYDYLK